MHPAVRRLLAALVVITVFLGCLFTGHALGNTALGGIVGLFAAALLGDRLTGCGPFRIGRGKRR